RDAVGELGRMMIGQQEAAGAETDIFGLQESLREDEIGRGMRLPGRGVMLADPGLLIAELVEPAQRLQVPVLAFLQTAFRRMRGHRKISEFHGLPLAVVMTRRLLRTRSFTRDMGSRHGLGRVFPIAAIGRRRIGSSQVQDFVARGRASLALYM